MGIKSVSFQHHGGLSCSLCFPRFVTCPFLISNLLTILQVMEFGAQSLSSRQKCLLPHPLNDHIHQLQAQICNSTVQHSVECSVGSITTSRRMIMTFYFFPSFPFFFFFFFFFLGDQEISETQTRSICGSHCTLMATVALIILSGKISDCFTVDSSYTVDK